MLKTSIFVWVVNPNLIEAISDVWRIWSVLRISIAFYSTSVSLIQSELNVFRFRYCDNLQASEEALSWNNRERPKTTSDNSVLRFEWFTHVLWAVRYMLIWYRWALTLFAKFHHKLKDQMHMQKHQTAATFNSQHPTLSKPTWSTLTLAVATHKN